MDVTIQKSQAKGSISAPPSKSMAHRYIISAALSDGQSVVRNVDFSQDILATLDCIKALGATVEVAEEASGRSTVTITGMKQKPSGETTVYPCRESGSTMRFFMGLALYYGNPSKFFGSETLRNRPFSVYEKICADQHLTFDKKEDHIYLQGKVAAGEYEIPGNISSQFITGLMYVLPLCDTDSVIHLIPPVESRSYLDLTIQALETFGVQVRWENENDIVIPGGQSYQASEVSVEGDYSNAAFLEAFNTVGGSVTVEGLNPASLQGDRVYLGQYEQLKKPGAVIDLSDCPDLGPILFSVAAANFGGTFTGTARLKMKESDRGTVMCEELKKFGIATTMEENRIVIGSGLKAPTEALCGHNDHRIVMSMAFLSSITGGTVTGAEATRKSYPGFFEDMKILGIEVQ